MEFSWSIHSPNKDAPPVNRHNELSAAPQKDSGVVVEVDATVNQPLNDNSSIISPEWLISASTEDESTALQSRSLYSSSHSDDKEILDAPLGDFGDILDWTFEDDGTGNSPNYLVPCASPFDNALHSSPDFAPSGVATDVSLTRPSQASEVLEDRRSSPLSLCSCTSRLSTLLFNLSGYLRQYSQSTPPNSMRACGTQLRHHISLVFAIHGRAIQLGHYLISCESQCMADGSNTVQLVMLIEQLVDLYAGFLEQLSVVSRADDNGAASVEMAIQVRVGEYRVEDVLENRTIIALLVNERLKSITELTVRFRERLQNLPGQAGKCRERLHVAIERLELLRNR
ncbi:hypothetical protein PHISCL_04951 [Aspergillus sclerotialis]|uniref:Uncharacterized protein n=1 Tax=Aspergillus sclerotialis TaxID=2070753 RepID=A0A3A2ZXK7_9EURO|nr:hypothetical protein PHISCL_04951 [Aspergillus sclerotialis]